MSLESTIPDDSSPAGLPGISRSGRPGLIAVVLAIVLIALVLAGAIFLAQTNQATDHAQRGYQAQRQRLDQSVQEARKQGMTAQDLAPITSRQKQVESEAPPQWIGGRPGFYQSQTAALSQLQTGLRERQTQLVSDVKAATGQNFTDVKKSMLKAQQAGVDSASLQSVQQRLDLLIKSEQAATALSDFRTVEGQARQLVSEVDAIATAQQQENQLIQQAAQQLIAQNGGDINRLRPMAKDLLAKTRNDASVAAYMDYGKQFKGDYLKLNVAYFRLEHYAPMVDSTDLNQVAMAAAAGQRYGGQVHDLLFKGLPAKAIILSHQAQELWAYQNGQQVQDTLITTGRPALPTDLGPMHVLWKSKPWTMKSPWPKGSPYWYPDTKVEMVVWFTNTGEGFHDASWQPENTHGPGSDKNEALASHGCVHTPMAAEQFLYNWADNGTSVIIYPGDGSSVANQLSQKTTDPNGVPKNGEGYRGA